MNKTILSSVAGLALFLILFTCPVLAQDAMMHADKMMISDTDKPYWVRMPYRILRGVTNIALGWTEIMVRPIAKSKTETFFRAVAAANRNTALRLFAGVGDLLTFWMPDNHKAAMYPYGQEWPCPFKSP